MNVFDESLLLDNPEYTFLEPLLKKLRVRDEALPLLNLPLSRLDDRVHHRSMQSPVREVRSASALSVTARRRVARSLHRLSRPQRECRKGAAGAASLGHVGTRRLPASHNFSKRPLLENFDSQSPVARSWLSCCRTATKEILFLLGSGAALMARHVTGL